jgi:hypothetical protein
MGLTLEGHSMKPEDVMYGGSRSSYLTEVGTFDLPKWKKKMAKWATNPGTTISGLVVIDEPGDPE